MGGRLPGLLCFIKTYFCFKFLKFFRLNFEIVEICLKTPFLFLKCYCVVWYKFLFLLS